MDEGAACTCPPHSRQHPPFRPAGLCCPSQGARCWIRVGAGSTRPASNAGSPREVLFPPGGGSGQRLGRGQTGLAAGQLARLQSWPQPGPPQPELSRSHPQRHQRPTCTHPGGGAAPGHGASTPRQHRAQSLGQPEGHSWTGAEGESGLHCAGIKPRKTSPCPAENKCLASLSASG